MRRARIVWPVLLASLLYAAPVSASTLALDAPDGSVVVTHSASGYSGDVRVIARYDGAGDLDETFGIEGYRRSIGDQLIRQPDGRLITYGASPFASCCNDDGPSGLWRHLRDGALDESFGAGGRVAHDMGVTSAAALAGDGSIVIAYDDGSCTQVRRVGGDGTLDPGFAGEPICTGVTPIHLAVAADGIYVGGPTFVARLTSDDGRLDDSFGEDGILQGVPAERTLPTGAGLVLLGTARIGDETRWVVERYRADGTPDAGFGANGRLELPGDPSFTGSALGEASDGSLLVATTVVEGDAQRVTVTGVTPDGDIDAAYGGGFEIGQLDALGDLVVLPDRGVVVSLRLDDPIGFERLLGLVRLTASGDVDTGFGDGGRVSTGFDVVGPSTTITATETTGTSATFTFSATEPDATFRCSVPPQPLEPGDMTPCEPGVHYEGLAEGQRAFYVRALDRRGNSGPLAQSTWVANARPPETTLTAAPPAQDRQTVARFALQADEPGAFVCSLDGVPLEPSFLRCRPAVTVSVGAGEHVFTAQAVDSLGGRDPTPVVHRWSVDLDAPDTRIDGGPPPTTTARSAELSFSSSDPAAGFECRHDGAAWVGCSSPARVEGLGPGAHDFQVRAVDPAGNRDASGAERLWRIEEPPAPGPGPLEPSLRVSAAGRVTHRAGGPRTVLQRIRVRNGVGRRGTIRLCATYPRAWRAPERARGRRLCLRRAIAAGADTTFALRGRPPRRRRTGTLRYTVAFPALATQVRTARWLARPAPARPR